MVRAYACNEFFRLYVRVLQSRRVDAACRRACALLRVLCDVERALYLLESTATMQLERRFASFLAFISLKSIHLLSK